MWARVSQYRGESTRIGDAARLIRGDLTVSRMRGFKKAFFFADRATGRALTITLWDSEEAMKASAQGVHSIRTGINEALGGTQGPTVEEFELVEEIDPGSGTELLR
jgi:heme-degrading monooxygenase HmoA